MMRQARARISFLSICVVQTTRYTRLARCTHLRLGTDACRVEQYVGRLICLRRLYTLPFLFCTNCSRPQACATLYGIVVSAGSMFGMIVEHCSLISTGSSKGRGTRAAGWFGDCIAKHGDEHMRSLVLLGGVKGWATAGAEFVEWMDEYDAAIWASS
jgi:hypothetical protein